MECKLCYFAQGSACNCAEARAKFDVMAPQFTGVPAEWREKLFEAYRAGLKEGHRQGASDILREVNDRIDQLQHNTKFLQSIFSDTKH
jgi:flagellar biosynthesis/type III secretory pathway protein FliH